MPGSSRLTVPQTVLPLPGALDDTPFFNSNSPEIVLRSGVLLSTFPGEGKAFPEAHLNYPMSGRCDVFFHHITNAHKTGTGNTLYLGLLAANASDTDVQVRLLEAISYSTKPDAPFKPLEPAVDNDDGSVYAGPGDRVALDLLRGHKQADWLDSITLAPGQSILLYGLPVSVHSLLHPLNGRTGILRLDCDGPIHLASLAAFARSQGFMREREPTLEEWLEVLNCQPLVQPRDAAPTIPGAAGELIYGRVAGIAKGSTWSGLIINDRQQNRLSLAPGQMISYPLSTVFSGTAGTGQVQAAPMIARYPDTAYQAHGNYGVLYDLTLPLYNNCDEETRVSLTFQSPLKDWSNATSLQFYEHPPDVIVFRGTVKFEWDDLQGDHHVKLFHLVHKKGQQMRSLVEFSFLPHQLQVIKITLVYPADCTPPQVLTMLSFNG